MLNSPILITGGAGFIGSNLVDLLVENGHSVRVFDNFSTGKRNNLPIDNHNVEIVVGDIADIESVKRAMKGCSAVVHLAAIASVQASVEFPEKTHQSNFIGTLNICEAMREENIKRVVFASSAAIYGNNGEGQSIIEDIPKSPLTPYASDKLASEYYLDFYRRQYHLEPIIFRFFNVYGPRQDPSSPYSGVISIFSDLITKNAPITIFGDGEQTRDFIYVGDLVSILLKAIEIGSPPKVSINLGLNKATTLNQILNTLSEITGITPLVNYVPTRSGDIRHSRADNNRLLEFFTLDEPTTLDSGLSKLLMYKQQISQSPKLTL